MFAYRSNRVQEASLLEEVIFHGSIATLTGDEYLGVSKGLSPGSVTGHIFANTHIEAKVIKLDIHAFAPPMNTKKLLVTTHLTAQIIHNPVAVPSTA